MHKQPLKAQAKAQTQHQGLTRYCVFYQANGHEQRSPWFSDLAHAEQARRTLADRHGRAVIYRD